VSYDYEKGAFARISVSYDDATNTLAIGDRAGSYPGMAEKRTFNVRWIEPGENNAGDLNTAPDATIEYSGQSVTVKQPSH
jgi:alpha-D-xyloside xylohydrolase